MPVLYAERITDVMASLVIRTRQANAEIAEDIAETARMLVPVDTGDLQASIEVVEMDEVGDYGVVAGGVEGAHQYVDYAAYIEFGTSRRPATPFLIPAVEAERERAIATQQKAIIAATQDGILKPVPGGLLKAAGGTRLRGASVGGQFVSPRDVRFLRPS